MALDETYPVALPATVAPWERGGAFRVYESPLPGAVSFYTLGADAGSRLSREQVAHLRDALTRYLDDTSPAPASPSPTFAAGDRVKISDRPRTAVDGWVSPDFGGKVGEITNDGRKSDDGNYRVRVGFREQWIAPEFLSRVEDAPKPEAPRFSVGDRVRIAAGARNCLGPVANRYHGAVGTVRRVMPCGCHAVRVAGAPEPVVLGEYLSSADETPSSAGFSRGDRIRVKSGMYAGKVGEVLAPENVYGNVRVRLDGPTGLKLLSAHVLEPEPFATGDRVRIGDNPRRYDGAAADEGLAGSLARIVREIDDDGEILVETDAGRRGYMMPSGVTRVAQDEASPKRFATGDRVRIAAEPETSTGAAVNPAYAGGVGEVVRNGYRDGNYFVRLIERGPSAEPDDGTWREDGQFIGARHLTRLDGDDSVFRPGARVRIADDAKADDGAPVDSRIRGAIGVVRSGPDSDGDYKVYREGDDSDVWNYVAARFLTPEPAPESLSVGDFAYRAGGTVVKIVEDVDSDGDYYVQNLRTRFEFYAEADTLKRIERVTDSSPLASGDRIAFLECGESGREPVGELGKVERVTGRLVRVRLNSGPFILTYRSRLGRIPS